MDRPDAYEGPGIVAPVAVGDRSGVKPRSQRPPIDRITQVRVLDPYFYDCGGDHLH
jgi:hypothetical protein